MFACSALAQPPPLVHVATMYGHVLEDVQNVAHVRANYVSEPHGRRNEGNEVFNVTQGRNTDKSGQHGRDFLFRVAA